MPSAFQRIATGLDTFDTFRAPPETQLGDSLLMWFPDGVDVPPPSFGWTRVEPAPDLGLDEPCLLAFRYPGILRALEWSDLKP